MNIVLIVMLVIAAEIILMATVQGFRRNFQWLITKKDENPVLDAGGLHKFINSSYDPHLGWVRRPNTEGTEKGRKGQITFHIDAMGSRKNSESSGPPFIASFGDSYVFCRQVEDYETWQAELNRQTGKNVLNFGVGNYGADQALLRFEQMELPDSVRVAILGFVPETICRVQSYWKHYLEFGNTFAFKPRFIHGKDDELTLLENPVIDPDDFYRLWKILPSVKELDGFYERKFRSCQFRFPYLVSFARHPKRNTAILSSLLYRTLSRPLGVSSGYIENLPFKQVMKYNILEAHAMYSDLLAVELLKRILIRFRDKAEEKGYYPLVLVMPQLLDLELTRGKKAPYQSFFQKLNSDVPTLDLTDTFRESEYGDLYIEDQYGGHLSKAGNCVVAERIREQLLKSNIIQTG